ncbi:MAG: SurA N-terminal domain-containing protein, partial [Acidobacteriota bacterium]
KAALVMIALAFVWWGGSMMGSHKDTRVARVGDHYITIAEQSERYNQMIEMYRRQLGGAFSEELIKGLNLRAQAVKSLIDEYVMSDAAKELGLTATTDEVQKKILSFPMFQADGKFNQERYVTLLRQNRLSPEKFEEDMAREITMQKVEEFVKRRAVVTDEEIQTEVAFNYGQAQIAYVPFDSKSFEGQVVVNDKDLQAFYEGRKQGYMDPEKRRFAVAVFKPETYAGEIKLSEDDLRRAYDEKKDEYHHEAEVSARHILFPVKQDAPKEEVDKVEAEAKKVLAEAKAGKDFAELAKKYSKDPGSAEKGGDLGFFSRDQMVPAFSDAAFNLKPGEISDLVRSDFGFHIIKVDETRPERTEAFEEVKGNLEQSLKEEKARDIAFQKAREFGDAAFASKDLPKTAESMKVSFVAMDKPVSRNDPLPGLDGPVPEAMGKLFALSDKEVSEVVETPQGFVVAQVEAIQPPQQLAFDQVKDRVDREYRADKAKTLAQAKASELIEAARKDKSLEAAAKAANLEAKKSEWFTRRSPDKDLKMLQGEGLNTVLRLDEAKPFPDAPIQAGPRYLAVQLLGKKAPEAETVEKEQPAVRQKLVQAKEGELMRSWIDERRREIGVEEYKTD